jgi:crotonobetainyl-CoA:carnitine CoA-transferase CaiB-like acyl-CoA transferase
MCTSFAVYADRPLYGMNFDFPEVELKFRIANESSQAIFYLCVEGRGAFHETTGMNASGLFAASQILVAPFEIHPQPTDVLVSPKEVFFRALQTGFSVDDVLSILGTQRLGYRTDRKGHYLYADRHGAACVLEPAPNGNAVYRSVRPFIIMTNRPVRRDMDRAAENIARLGLDRYRIAHAIIQKRFPTFSVEDAFEVLRQTHLWKGRFKTLTSMVFDPQAGEVYLALDRDFDKIWRICMPEHTIEMISGNGRYWQDELGENGITASQLRKANLEI